MKITQWDPVVSLLVSEPESYYSHYEGHWPKLVIRVEAAAICPVCQTENSLRTYDLREIYASERDIENFPNQLSTLQSWLFQGDWLCQGCGVASQVPSEDRPALAEQINRRLNEDWLRGLFASREVVIMSRHAGRHYGAKPASRVLAAGDFRKT